MPQPPFDVVAGTAARRTITIRDADGVALADCLGTDPLAAEAWAGDDAAVLFAPTVAWDDAASARVELTITPAMTADLAPGTYRLQVFWTPPSDGYRRCILDGSVRVLPTAGSGTSAPVYATYEDLLDSCPRIGVLQDEFADRAGFAEQRARARAWLDEEILRYYHPTPGRSRREADEAGTGPGSFVTFADPPDGASVPSDDELEAMLDADGLVVTDRLVEAVSHKAAAYVYGASQNAGYAQEAGRHHAEAYRLYYNARVEVKSDPELDEPDLRIGRDVTFLVH